MIWTLCSRRRTSLLLATTGAKAVISIGRPYKFAVPASVKRAQVLRRYIVASRYARVDYHKLEYK